MRTCSRAILVAILVTACTEEVGLLDIEPQAAVRGRAPMLATAVATGSDHACAIGVDRRTYCWGANWAGQLGNGSGSPGSAQAVPVSGGRSSCI